MNKIKNWKEIEDWKI